MTGILTLIVLGVIGMQSAGSTAVKANPPSVEGVLTEYRENPLGVDNRHPGLSWRIGSTARGTKQTAYQIQVASSKTLLRTGKPDMWNSGKVTSSRCTAVLYAGKVLKSRTRYFWKVRIWDQNDLVGEFSQPASFEMGILDPKEWHGHWIIPNDPGSGNGYHSALAESVDTTKWVQIDLGKTRSFKSIILYPARPYNWKHDDPGLGFPVKYRVEASDDESFTNPRVISDRTNADQPNPKTEPVKLDVGSQSARYVRLVTTKLHHPFEGDPMMALAEIEVIDENGTNIALGKRVTALDAIEKYGWSMDRLSDGGRVSRQPDESSPIMRRTFALNKPIASARAYVTGLGYYELYLNGKKVGDRVLDPPYTSFDKRVYYSVYDVTRMLTQGNNCVGAMLGHGWWHNTPRFLLQLNITFADGSKTSIITDERWKWAPGPVVENSIYNGETFDARKEQIGWKTADFSDSTWQKVAVIDSPQVHLSAQMIQPIKVTETLSAKRMTSPKPGIYVFNFGQNFSGWCRIKLSGPAGTEVKVKHAEILHPDGTVNQENLRSAKATDTYILRGEGQEVYEPRFTYHGFRYVQVEGYPGTPTLGSISGRVVHTSFEPTGVFACSNELINKIQQCSVWGEKTNFHSIPTDCPQRDERQGWMGDAHMSADAMLYNFDMPSAYVKFLTDIKDAQSPDGSVPDTVPHVWGGEKGDPMWSAAYPLILWNMYIHTGDKHLFKEHYDGIKRYVDSLQKEADNYILERNTYGDWIGVVGTPKPLISTGSFYLVSDLLSKMADALGKTADSAQYRKLCSNIAEAFNKKFFNPQTRQYGNTSQFSNAFPLYLGIVPEEYHKDVLENLVIDINDRKGHLSTGFIGTPYLMDVLVREGRADLAYTIATREDYPGWGYMINNGATTIWELWELKTGNGMNSHNHPALGLISGWFYRTLTGITPDPIHPGWEHFTVKPYVVGDLKHAEASVNTLRGEAASAWKITDTGLHLDVTIPAGSTATVSVPKAESRMFEIKEGQTVIWKDGAYVPGDDGISSGKDADKWVEFEAGSGSYSFDLTNYGPIPLTSASLFIPTSYKPKNGTIDIAFHLHGSSEKVRECFVKSGIDAVLITVSFNGLSAVYSKPFSKDPELFGKIIEEAKEKVAARYGLREVKLRKLALSSFSAGFGAVREILKSPDYSNAVTDLVLVDTLYAGYVQNDGKNYVDPDDMKSFEPIVERAANGKATVWITYSGVVPPGYASTFETAEYLLNKVGGKLEPASGNEAPGLNLISKADTGNFHVRGYAGNDGPAHMQHLYNLDVFYKRTTLATRNP